jgi:hypothetical protein
MNNRHIQTFLTVSAAFFAMSAPLHSNASSNGPANAIARSVQYTACANANVGTTEGAKSGRQS